MISFDQSFDLSEQSPEKRKESRVQKFKAKVKKFAHDQLSCFRSSQPKVKKVKQKRPATKLSARMKRASSQGFQIMQNILFPSIPAVFQDLWVYIELGIALTAFVLGALDVFQSDSISIYTYVYFVLAVISFLFVLIDGYLYFIELGSCARGYRFVREKLAEKRQQTEADSPEDRPNNGSKKCFRLSPKWKKHIATWFEVIRNAVTELLLYPLLIFDLLSFIVEQGYEPSDTVQRVDFSLFLMESFYLVLSVYIMRIVLVTTSTISLIKLPADKSDDSTKPILVRFSIHMLGQIIVHLLIVLVVAAKINNENPIDGNASNATNSADDDDNDINASYYLIAAMVTGGIVPLAGSAVFFVANYYWMRQFSISFWVNMISLLQGESFAEAVFGGGVSSQSKAQDFVQQSQLSKVKKELKKYKSPSLLTKLLFPAKFPLLVVILVSYYFVLLTFVVSLMLTDGTEDSITFAIFREDHFFSVLFLLTSLGLTFANIHILVIVSVLLIAFVLLSIVFIVFTAISIVASIACIFPVLGGVGFSLLIVDICSSLCSAMSCKYHRKKSEGSIFNEMYMNNASEEAECFEKQQVIETKV